MAGDDRLAGLEARLGHRFADRALLEQALTHASALNGDEAGRASYQRLEFLGDRVLGLAVAAMLFDRFPSAPEGQLSRALADLVRKETCAAVAIKLDLGPCLVLGRGERRTGLAKKLSVLGDACEALLGAVYRDAGFAAASALVHRLWQDRLPELGSVATADPKTALQEWAHSQGLAEPRYEERGRSGPDHAPEFCIAVLVAGLEPVEASGKSKRAAERAAAQRMLARQLGDVDG
ncbi:MAG TPA: ribonuclease III [Beijerinckiaceae bacterium]|nr:ribonuclease III [Beijerinckiaceae bacterium]